MSRCTSPKHPGAPDARRLHAARRSGSLLHPRKYGAVCDL
jgi:hypothetical protein